MKSVFINDSSKKEISEDKRELSEDKRELSDSWHKRALKPYLNNILNCAGMGVSNSMRLRVTGWKKHSM